MVLRSRERGRVGRRRHPIGKPLSLRDSGAFCFVANGPTRQPAIFHSMPHAGILTVVGKPNAGKSTLLNRIVGEKLSIVSPKPQSTRDRIVGIHTTGDVQLIILDTPGLLNPRYALQKAMRGTALAALEDADVILYLADGSAGPPEPLTAVAQLEQAPKPPTLLAFNKADLISQGRRDEL